MKLSGGILKRRASPPAATIALESTEWMPCQNCSRRSAVEARGVLLAVADLRAQEVVEVRLVPGLPVMDLAIALCDLPGEVAESHGIGVSRPGLTRRRALCPARRAPHSDERRQAGGDRVVDLLVRLGPVVRRATGLRDVPVEDDPHVLRAGGLDARVRVSQVVERRVRLLDRRGERMGGGRGRARAEEGNEDAASDDGDSRLFTNRQCFVRGEGQGGIPEGPPA